MKLDRLLPADAEEEQPEDGQQAIVLAMWLDLLEADRDALIMRLRAIDRVLIAHGRLAGETLPRRRR